MNISPAPFRPPLAIGRMLAILVVLVAVTTPLRGLDVPPSPDRWFTDRAGVVPQTTADLLNRKLADFEQQTGAQFIIYVLPGLEGDPVEDFTMRAVEQWKIGQKKYDNGVVLFVFVEERKVRVEVGYGLEGTITDAFSSRVIREIIAPLFQAGDYGGGLEAGAEAIMTKIRTGEEPVPPMRRRGARGSEREDIGIIPVLVILFVVFFVIAPMFSRRGSRGCGGCIFPFFFFPGGGVTFGGRGHGGWGGGGFGGGFGGGGFGGGGGGFGGGGATGGW